MDFTEAEAFDVLGVEPEAPAEAPQGGAETGQEGSSQAGEVPQAPEAQEVQEPPADGQESGNGQDAPQSPNPEEQAAQLHKQQVEQAVAQAIQAERERQAEQLKSFFKRADLKNSITGKDITSMEDFEAWERAYQAQRLQQELAEGRLSPEGLDQAIANSPAVRRAEELARQAERQEQEQQRARFQVFMQEQMAEIHKMDHSVNSLEDIVHGPDGARFCDYVKNRGLSFVDAFRLTNFDRLQRMADATVQQAARNQARELERSKDHLTGAGTVQGKGAAPVPSAEMALFHALLPDASESEIQNYYNKHERSLEK